MIRLLIPLFALALLIGCTPQDSTTGTDTDTYGYETSSVSGMDASAAMTTSSSPAAMSSAKASVPAGFDGKMLKGTYVATMKTSKGDIVIELYADKAPKTVTNFVLLAKSGYYDGLTFHRVIPDFMIQGGDPTGTGAGGESIFGSEFEDEKNDISMDRGVLAMANRGPNTNGSQFFIIQAADGTPWLQGKHTAFGRVTKGMDIVDAITKVERNANDKPTTPVTFSVTIADPK